MPGDPKECRDHASRCLKLAGETRNVNIRETLLNIAKHWQVLADELDRARAILDDEKGGLKLAIGRKAGKRARTKKKKRKVRTTRSRAKPRSKRTNGESLFAFPLSFLN